MKKKIIINYWTPTMQQQMEYRIKKKSIEEFYKRLDKPTKERYKEVRKILRIKDGIYKSNNTEHK